MALLDKANTETFGNPEITEVNIGVGNKPGILISGHDLADMKELLEQTKDTGVEIYTHSEMLPANYYPEFKKYSHFHGNYGSSWWNQKPEFESFKGPTLPAFLLPNIVGVLVEKFGISGISDPESDIAKLVG